MIPIDGLSWQQFTSLPHISKLSLQEQIRQYNIYSDQILQESILIQQMLSPNVPSVSGGGSSVVTVVEQEGLPSNCIEFVVDTTDDTYFEFEITVSADTTYTVTWGDGNTGNGSLTTGATSIDHTYDNSSEQYTVRFCFGDISLVTGLEFFGND